jgi:hypothetical protein
VALFEPVRSGGCHHRFVHTYGLFSVDSVPCQLDVIESNFKLLEEGIGAAHDFAEVERVHTSYLHALVNQCFLNTGTITRAIGTVFSQAEVSSVPSPTIHGVHT